MADALLFRLLPICVLTSLLSVRLSAQSAVSPLCSDDYTISAEDKGTLGLSIDNFSFFRNIETDGDVYTAYSLPGFRISPRLIYFPTSQIKLEAGLSLLKYWGAEKYPNYAYQDIAEWKSDDYQRGFHLTPFFRAHIQPLSSIQLVFGNIYGGGTHRLVEPLYNRELNLTADPETGIQFLYNSSFAHVDAWVNWESFTFRTDTHDEAFTVGGSSQFNLIPSGSDFYLDIPLQALVIHRGGELDSVAGNTTTKGNAAVGLKVGFRTGHPLFRSLNAEIYGLGYLAFDDNDEYLPFDKGWGLYAGINGEIGNLRLKLNYWRSANFVNIFGNPAFGNISYVHRGWTFRGVSVFNPGLAYEQEFGKGYVLAADLECFINPDLDMYMLDDRYLKRRNSSLSCSIGVYLRVNPSIILKR